MNINADENSQSGFTLLAGLLLASILIACALTGIKVYDSRQANGGQPIKSTNSGSTSKTTKTVSFYGKIQNGMSYDQVVALAGGDNGDCEYSGAPPPTDYMYCTWPDDSSAVTVSFKDHKVTSKSQQPAE